jgi:hypothetical protein
MVVRAQMQAPCLRGFDENVPPVHLDGIRAAAVDGSEPEMHMVASRSDGVGADVSRLDGLGCGAHTCLSGVAGLVVDMDGMRAVGPGGGESDACAGASSTGITVNPLVVVVYSPLTVWSVSNMPVSTNRASRDAINVRVVGSSSLYPHDLSAVMFHIILTSETLLTSQRPLRYTAAAFSVTTADFFVQMLLPPLPSLSFAAVIIVTTTTLSVTAADFAAQCHYRCCRLCHLPPAFPLPLLPSPSLLLPPLPAPPPTDVHIRSTRSGNGLTIRRHHIRDG